MHRATAKRATDPSVQDAIPGAPLFYLLNLPHPRLLEGYISGIIIESGLQVGEGDAPDAFDFKASPSRSFQTKVIASADIEQEELVFPVPDDWVAASWTEPVDSGREKERTEMMHECAKTPRWLVLAI